jgi:precorrin-2 dehydrogenase/sirohydrochlorin ferrochelatase
MAFLPICVEVKDRPIVMIGGGRIALQKLTTIMRYADTVTVIAPSIDPRISSLPLRAVESAYEPSQLDGAFLVYACTDDREVNRRVAADARSRGILVNVADDTEACAFVSPAVHTNGNLSVAVSSNGSAPRKARELRDHLIGVIDGFLESQHIA